MVLKQLFAKLVVKRKMNDVKYLCGIEFVEDGLFQAGWLQRSGCIFNKNWETHGEWEDLPKLLNDIKDMVGVSPSKTIKRITIITR